MVGGKMSDDRVLQMAMSDKASHEGRIQALRNEITQHEQQMAEVDHFIEMFRRYSSLTPASA